MKKTSWCYDREFKISIVSELEPASLLLQISYEYGIYPSFP